MKINLIKLTAVVVMLLLISLSPAWITDVQSMMGGGGNTTTSMMGGGGNTTTSMMGGGGNTTTSMMGGGGNTTTSMMGGGGNTTTSMMGGGGNTTTSMMGGGGNTTTSMMGGGGNTTTSMMGGGGNTTTSMMGGGGNTTTSMMGGGGNTTTTVTGGSGGMMGGSSRMGQCVIADLDNDKIPEIVTIVSGRTLVIMDNEENVISSKPLPLIPGQTYQTGVAGGLDVADLDGDGIPEIVTTYYIRNYAMWYGTQTSYGTYLVILDNQGNLKDSKKLQ